MTLKVFSLKGIEFQDEVSGFNVQTMDGEITILSHHHPIITILKKGTARIIKKDDSRMNLAINSGFLEMNPQNELNVLID